MAKIQVYCRDDGSLGIRNHLFVLPAVVCANQVAIDVARRNPKFKFIEHQHGCAQIGADLIQTQRVFSNLSLHPNVYASLFVGLGCEGIIAKDLYQQTKDRTQKPLGFVSIQGSGGTLKAQERAESWLYDRDAEIATITKTSVSWEQIRIGVLLDDVLSEDARARVKALIDELYDLGVNLVLADSTEDFVAHLSIGEHLQHGAFATERVSVIEAGSNVLETATGLTAAGAHLLIHLATEPHAFGIPLAPVVRFALSDPIYDICTEDFDGSFLREADIVPLLDKIHAVLEGQEAVAETFGLDDFALYRIGPTV